MSQSERPWRIPPCPDCGGVRVSGARLGARGASWLTLWPARSFGFSNICGVRTLACLGCGKLEMYASDVASLRRFVEEHADQFGW